MKQGEASYKRYAFIVLFFFLSLLLRWCLYASVIFHVTVLFKCLLISVSSAVGWRLCRCFSPRHMVCGKEVSVQRWKRRCPASKRLSRSSLNEYSCSSSILYIYIYTLYELVYSACVSSILQTHARRQLTHTYVNFELPSIQTVKRAMSSSPWPLPDRIRLPWKIGAAVLRLPSVFVSTRLLSKFTAAVLRIIKHLVHTHTNGKTL